MKLRIKFISIIVIINIISILTGIFVNIVRAADIKQTLSNDINSLDEKKYPGIKSKINELKKQYPNWNFKILYTGINWEDAIKYEYTGHGSSPKNLVPISNNYSGNWVCSICKDETYDSGAWKCASEEAIKYMMDPRNSINETDVFQFLELSYDKNISYSKEKIKSILNGSFLKDEKYTDTIMNACKEYNVNPYYIVARILQEQKKEGTTLTKGQGYNGQYVGFYNVFNIGASGNGKEKVILNGLANAKKYGWDTLEKSISGGIQIIASKYIALGQNTMYLQKFDVDNSDGNMYWHQYMQNILAAQSEGETLRKTVTSIGTLDSNYNFIIPVYENMPGSQAPRPSITQTNITLSGDLVKVNVNSSLKIRNEPAGSQTVGYIYAGETITRLEKATSKLKGTYWDKILSSSGVEGYVARCTYDSEDSYKLYLVPLNEQQEDNNSKQTNSNVSKIANTNTSSNTNATANTNSTSSNTQVDTFIRGDVNGDGKIDSADLLYLKKYLLNRVKLTNMQSKAADTSSDGKIDSADLLNLKRYLLGKITLK